MGFVKQKERQKSDCSEVFLPQKDKVKILQSTLSLASDISTLSFALDMSLALKKTSQF